MSRLTKDPRVTFIAAAVALALVLTGGWMLLIAPLRAEAVELEQGVAVKHGELATRRAELAAPAAELKVRASDLYRLTKALPDATDMAGVLLDIDQIAAANDLTFRSIVPGTPLLGPTALNVPIALTVQGRFTSVARFLRDVRELVSVRDGALDARGRAYSVTQVDLGAPDKNEFPLVKATITLNAHSFVAPVPAITTPSSTGTVAAGATP